MSLPSERHPKVEVRNTTTEDFAPIIEMSGEVYRGAPPWTAAQLASHLTVFPEGQFVAAEVGTGRLLGMTAGLIVCWDDYDDHDSWKDFTDGGLFTNHDPENGRTLYGAEVMVRPNTQRRGVGSKLYRARFELAQRLELRRIRAAARLRGYAKHCRQMSAKEYVAKVLNGELKDATLSFQLKHGFRVISVVSDYLLHDMHASQGYAAIIEWKNPEFTDQLP